MEELHESFHPLDEEERKRLSDCVAYFKARPVYDRLFKGLREKYAGLGHFGGSVTLHGLSAEDKLTLGGFLQKDYAENKSVTVSAALLARALGSSRFAGLSWEAVLEAYFKEPLTVKKEERQRAGEEKTRFFEEILYPGDGKEAPCPEGKAWLTGLLEGHTQGYVLLMQLYREDKEALKRMLKLVLKAIGLLPGLRKESFKEKEAPVREYLAVFAAKVTGDPHFFDQGKVGERLLYSFIRAYFFGEGGTDAASMEEKTRLYYEAGLLRDGLSNDVAVYGLLAWKKDGRVHAGIEGFCRCMEPVRLTLQTLSLLVKAAPGSPQEERVYVVENPVVFSYLAASRPERALICGNGQLKLAVLVLMDLVPEKYTIYYAGDYDPEGLLIAQRLKERYGERLRLWKYDVSTYEACHSEVLLSEERIRKLDRIRIGELEALVGSMRRIKKAAYQEAMLHIYE